MFIDDCKVYSRTNDEFVPRLAILFGRFRVHILFLEANKCFGGCKEFDFVGNSCLRKDWKYPVLRFSPYWIFTSTVSKQPRCFLGTENVSVKLCELSLQYWSHHMTDYSRARKTIVWNLEAWGFFQEAKFEVSRCATMRFLSDTAPIILQTDTSDYGLREYLFQSRKEDLEFVKSVDKAQL